MTRRTDESQGMAGQRNAARGAFRVCLTVTGLRCASEGAPLERALRRVQGVSDATVNPLRSRVALEVDRLFRLPEILRVLGNRGYSIDTGEVRATVWFDGAPEELHEIGLRLGSFPGVSYCRVGTPTGRFDLAFSLEKGWEERVENVCTWICEVARDSRRASPAGHGGK